MLKICTRFSDLDFEQLCHVYGYWEEGSKRKTDEFYDYLIEDFFIHKNSFYAVWCVNGEYVSALRMEPYEDGYLVQAVQTVKDNRKKGYAKCLLSAVLEQYKSIMDYPIYAHISKGNYPSLKLHRSCGFLPYLDHAAFIDGTISTAACTLKWEK